MNRHRAACFLGLCLLACGGGKDDAGAHAGPVADVSHAADGDADGSALRSVDVKTRFFSYYENIFLHVTIDGHPLLLLYDSGSPDVYIDEREAARIGLRAGTYDASIEGHSLGARAVLTTKTVFGAPLPGLPRENVAGYAGNSLFAGHAVGIDFRDHELWIHAASSGTLAEAFERPEGTRAEATSAEFQERQGYLTVPCGMRRGAADRVCLFDTGAMSSVVLERNWTALPHPRPETFSQTSGDSAGGNVHSYFQRDEATVVGNMQVDGDILDVTTDFSLLESVGRELHVDLLGLVGVLTFQPMYTTLDYVNHRITFQTFEDASWVPAGPLVGFGFQLDASTLSVTFVAPNSAAEHAGVVAGDELVAFRGAAVSPQQPPPLTFAMTIPGRAGDAAELAFERAGARRTVQIVAEDVLPPP